MTSVKKVYFPPPPPTFNTLTQAERAHLRRSAKKLSRVLGVTPQLVDDLEDATASLGELSSEFASMCREVESVQGSGFMNLDNTSVATSVEACSEWSHSSCPPSRKSEATAPDNATRRILTSLSSVDLDEDGWHRSNNACLMGSGVPRRKMKRTPAHRPPLLRVARSIHFYSISNFSSRADFPYPTSHPPTESDDSDDDDDDSLSDLCHSSMSSHDEDTLEFLEPPSPTFTVPSENYLRRKKMERLQRRFGEDVPVNMVFPDKRSDESGSESDGEGVVEQTETRQVKKERLRTAPAAFASFRFPPLEPASKRTTTTAGTPSSTTPASTPVRPKRSRIASARDSISISFSSPHKAPRKRPATPHPYHSQQSFICNDEETQQATPEEHESSDIQLAEFGLRTIVESPDEFDSVSATPKISSSVLESGDGAQVWEVQLGTQSSAASLGSERYLSDDDLAGKTAVGKKGLGRVWSHKRKPPPIYEP
ncbi:hypothetical protein AX15_003817 [Amanita polypyramis BW_CC]|nr:hypothetical protein AX15_003817 [Amanita polypyramis BW_CC]